MRGKDDAKNAKKYMEQLRKQTIYDTAAQAWTAGVPWEEALGMARRSVETAYAKPKAKAKAKSRR